MKAKLLSVIQYLLFLSVGVLLFWLSFRNLDLQVIWHDIKEADYNWLIIALVFAILSHIVRALRWNLLIGSLGYKTNVWITFYAVMIGYLANTAVPRMGEFVRCGSLSRKENIPFNALFGTVISERLFDLLVLFLLIVAVIVFQMQLVGGFVYDIFHPLWVQFVSNVWNIIIFSSLLFVSIVSAAWFFWRNRHRINHLPLYQRIKEFILGIWSGVKTIITLRKKALFLFYSFLMWFFYAAMTYFPMLMLQETSNLDFWDGITLLAISSLGIVAPVPGGIGAYHIIVVAVLSQLFQIEPNAAGSFAALAHAGQTLLNVLAGALSYFVLLVVFKNRRPLNEKAGLYSTKDHPTRQAQQ